MTTHQRIKIAEDIVYLLENRFKILGFKFGIDPLLGLVPVVGDLIPFVIAIYLVWVAWAEGLDRSIIIKMALLVLLDFIIGSIPIIGDAADFVFRAHTKNLEILKRELDV